VRRRAGRWAVTFALAGALGATACGSGGRQRPPTADSTRFGDDRATLGDSAPRAPEVALLERLVDQFERLDVVMDELGAPSSDAAVQHRAWSGDRHEDNTKQRLLDLLQAEFGERYHPRTPAGVAGTADSIGALPRAAGSRALDSLVLAHHRRVRTEIAQALPGVANARVRDTLAALAEHLDGEIRKLAGRR
jgi:hypothetical protein